MAKRQPRAPEIHDVRTWTAHCPRCGVPTKYHGQYAGESLECGPCMKIEKMHADLAPEGEE